MSSHNDYFDEAYYQRGDERGTAYRDYASSAPISPTFQELARALVTVFQPRRALEIGCATGAIVKHMNDLGVETHGIDVSEWAVKNRLHPNVCHAGAERLPYPDKHFDLVFSSHALEHIPSTMLPLAIFEIDRVAMHTAYQFHMLPMIGTHPYDYDPIEARKALRSDPTHNILEPREWWHECWKSRAWTILNMSISLENDIDNAELSSGQFTLCRGMFESQLMPRAFEWNTLVHRKLFNALRDARRTASRPTPIMPELTAHVEVAGRNLHWADAESQFADTVSLANANVQVIVELTSPTTIPMRIALVDIKGDVLEFWSEIPPGVSTIQPNIGDFRTHSGAPDLSSIRRVFFGGNLGSASMKVASSARLPSGDSVRLI